MKLSQSKVSSGGLRLARS